jgi:hypothetical protein
MDLSGASLLASLLVGTVGVGLFIYGKKQLRIPQLITGIALMVYPYFVGGALAIYGIAALLIGGMWAFVRFVE